LLYFIPQKRKRTIKKAEGWLLTNFLSLSLSLKQLKNHSCFTNWSFYFIFV